MDGPLAPLDDARRPTPYRPLLWLAVATGLGVAADNALESLADSSRFGWWWGGALAALAAALLASRRRRPGLVAALLLATAAALAAAWHHAYWNHALTADLARFAREEPQPTCVVVVLADRVKISPPADRSPLRAIPARTMSEATVEVVAIRDRDEWRPAGGLSRLRVAGEWRDAGRGDRLRLFAQLGRPPAPLNPGEYDWSAHERRNGRLTELYCDDPQCIEVVATAGALRLDAGLHGIRAWCERQLAANVGPRDAPIALATLLGDQERLSDSTKDAFLETGSIHLLVISGTHIAMLAGIVWQTARGIAMPTPWQLGVTIFTVSLYSLIVGAEPSVMRATILTIATLAAFSRGRMASAGNLLGAAALAVIFFNPCEVFRSGTQFSFIAVAVLAAFAQWHMRRRHVDPLERLLAEGRPWHGKLVRRVGWAFASMIAASLAVGIVLAPLVAHHFHIVTPASILLTPLAWPLMFVALTSGFGVLTIGWLVPPLGPLLGAACGWSLHATEQLVVAAQSLPYGYGYCAGPPAWWLGGFYGALGLLAAVPRCRVRWPWQASAGMLWLAAGFAAPALERPAGDQLRCTFLGMGHGLCAVLELPSGQTILYDAGNLGSPEAAGKTVASFLWSRGIGRIDAVVLSHADIDHYNGMPGLLKRFPIGAVYISPMMFDPIATDGKLNAPNYLRDVLAASGVPLREIWLGDRLQTADPRVVIEVLHPPREGVIGRDNANSLLVSVEFAGKRILLPGDLESPGIERVMADPPTDCDILLAPHHGSEHSDPPGFAAWCTPEWVVMSGQQPNRTKSTNLSYQLAGADVSHTAELGAIAFVVDGTGIAVNNHRD